MAILKHLVELLGREGERKTRVGTPQPSAPRPRGKAMLKQLVASLAGEVGEGRRRVGYRRRKAELEDAEKAIGT